MSAIFQRPLCDMGKAYDYAFRPTIGDPDTGAGGGCDDDPHPVELCAAGTDAASPAVVWRSFALCPEHESQLRAYDGRRPAGSASRFRHPSTESPVAREVRGR
jgi:hypothetical protein